MASNLARRGTQKSVPVAEAKAKVIELIQAGYKVGAACQVVGRAEETYRDWRKTDPEFKAAIDAIRSARAEEKEFGRAEVPDFPEFCEKWLRQPLFPHQLRMWDVMQGKAPAELHDAMGYEPGYLNRVLINVPPEHCPSIDTLVPSTRGLVPAGGIREGDLVFNEHGKPVEVLESKRLTPEVLECEQYRVTFNTGDSFVVDGSHPWLVRDIARGNGLNLPPIEIRTDMMAQEVRTQSGQYRWRVDIASATCHEAKDLPLDPYLLGYWLGDGDTNGSRFAVGEEDLAAFETSLTRRGFTFRVRSMKGGYEVYAHKMRHLLPLGVKRIPAEYMIGSVEQRMELLRGLLDSDGTIDPDAGRVRFVQDEKRRGLARDTYALIASLGYQPRMKQYGRMIEIGFRPGAEPVFGLERKAARQKPLPASKGKTTRRTIVAVERLDERVALQALRVAGGRMLIGEAHILTHNAKSTTWTCNYVVWRIHKDPDIRVVLVSKGLKLACDFLYEIQQKLTSSLYQEMHLRFAPEGGWKDDGAQWTHDRIYVKGKNENAERGIQRDPTVQAMGIKGQIYGRRCDLVILDDIIDADNAREVDTQIRKINRDISSRLPSDQEGGGLMAVLGTRVAPMDVYRVLNEQHDADDRKVWTYLRMPAVLDYGNGDSSSWTTLWPEKWSGPSLSRKRVDSGWNLYYQQLDVDDDMTFKAEAVNASINGRRFPGPMYAGNTGHRPGGMEGLYIACGLDPAASGNTAIIVAGLDPDGYKRWVIDGWNKPNATASDIIAKFREITDKYRPNEWVIEKNAFQRFLTQLPDIVDYARARGVRITPHHTQHNKFDADWGVSTMGPLFDSCVEWSETTRRWVPTHEGLIDLPSTRQNAWCAELVQQLTIWKPDGMAQKAKTDLVMAMWFTHLAFSKIIDRPKQRKTHLDSPFLTPAGRGRQKVIDLAALRAEKQQRQLEASA